MKRTTAPKFDENYVTLALWTKAISHPARIAILRFLQENNNQTCKSIVEQLPFSQSTVSQHLAELKQAGLITGNSYKTSMIYALDIKSIQQIQKLIQEVFQLQADKKQLSLF